jgi:PAS domain-containing protein
VLSWPLPELFGQLSWDMPGSATRQRFPLTVAGEAKPRWFEVQRYPQGGDRILFALPADDAVQAETALRSFVQTLTKTFAHLTIGLAIFDGNRQLALFNPALIDLTGLAPEFLSSRPTLFRLLDAMRERQMLPEPKDYKSWRAEIAALERAAASGQYEETWTLPNGQTYRVTGRPHPDGAVAFVIEDISAEMSLTRRFRADLELSHATIDTMEEAIAVFSPSGLLVFANAAYGQLWHDAPDANRDSSIAEAVRSWQRGSAVSPVWAEARAFVLETGARTPWKGSARLGDGRLLACRFAALPGGASLIGFAVVPPDRRGLAGVPETERQTA